MSKLLTKNPQKYAQNFAAGAGTGSIEQARGTDHVSADGITLTGEQDIFGASINTRALAGAEAAETTWAEDGTWNGHRWSGSSWSGSRWSGHTWSDASWT